MGEGVTTPPLLVAGLAVCLSVCLSCRCPAGVFSSSVIGNTWDRYYKSTSHWFQEEILRASERDSERETRETLLPTLCSCHAHLCVLFTIQHSTY